MVVLSDEQYKSLLELIEVTIDEKLDQKLDEKLKHLPSKKEFYNWMGRIMGRLDSIEQNTDVGGGRVSRNSDRIERIEKHLDLPHL